jgi:integration host factor subunit alpha
MAALTKAEMAEALFDQLGLNKREARELVDLFFEEIRAALSSGEQVKLSGFGNFDLRDKNRARKRNPKTGEEIPISARRVVAVRPGQKLKARVRGVCWNQATIANYRRSRESGISPSVSQRPVRRQTACAALLGAGVSPAQAGQTAR